MTIKLHVNDFISARNSFLRFLLFKKKQYLCDMSSRYGKKKSFFFSYCEPAGSNKDLKKFFSSPKYSSQLIYSLEMIIKVQSADLVQLFRFTIRFEKEEEKKCKNLKKKERIQTIKKRKKVNPKPKRNKRKNPFFF
ncbi:hypothetical protein M0811_03307 [Anaeramoeba ignava]|uniref:Uncharacterized protein n=1 Tax=Anaeramoeba ignava TaxID=1746090 RepID=A0A9Q0L6K5_ANAIG|nr:hypothetical protein M0811_03307 [Anaeramoeba ignava]